MNHAAFRQRFYQRLTSHYLQGELQALYHWCVQEVHGWSRAEAYLNEDRTLSPEDLEQWDLIIERLTKQEPIQYIFGGTEFYGLKIRVDENVLIPRPETEELVEWILKNESHSPLMVTDIGTGSGCIALALKANRPEWSVIGCDVSTSALDVARMNGVELELDVRWIEADVLQMRSTELKGDVWVSNPPYIPRNRIPTLEPRVLDHEPHLALFEEEPLQFFRSITLQAKELRVSSVYFETHAQEFDSLTRLVKEISPAADVEFKFDLAQRPRFLRVSF